MVNGYLTRYFLFLFVLFSSLTAMSDPLHFVFDIDDTLVVRTDSISDAEIVYKGKGYRVILGTPEILLKASIQGSVSFFSSGGVVRNQFLLSKILLPDGRTALEIATYIRSNIHLEKGNGNERWKNLLALTPEYQEKLDDGMGFQEALSQIKLGNQPTIDNILLIDDFERNIAPGQEFNFFKIDRLKSHDNFSVSRDLFSRPCQRLM